MVTQTAEDSNNLPPTALLVCCALPAEAAPWIEHYRMKPEPTRGRLSLWRAAPPFPLFLCQTEPGSLSAASATAAALAILRAREPYPAWRALNAGLAGCLDRHTSLGETFVIHHVSGEASARHFYPDLLVNYPLEERPCMTVSTPASAGTHPAPDPPGLLFDMEVEGFWHACQRFLPADAIQAIKTVSDHGMDPSGPFPLVAFKRTIAEAAPAWFGYAEAFLALPEPASTSLTGEEKRLLARAVDHARLTATQAEQLGKAAIHARLQAANVVSLFSRFLEIPAPANRRERNRWLDSLLHECFRT